MDTVEEGYMEEAGEGRGSRLTEVRVGVGTGVASGGVKPNEEQAQTEEKSYAS
jgi:hypothetical protein